MRDIRSVAWFLGEESRSCSSVNIVVLSAVIAVKVVILVVAWRRGIAGALHIDEGVGWNVGGCREFQPNRWVNYALGTTMVVVG